MSNALRRFSVVIVSLVFATLLRYALDKWLEDYTAFVTFYFAVLVSAWYGGSLPALTALILGAVIGVVVFIQPRPMSLTHNISQSINLITYLVVGMGIALLSHLLRAARQTVEARAVQLQQQYTQLQHEIAERKQIEHALQESEQRFRLIADTIPAMIWATDANSDCDYLNAYWEKFTGTPISAGLGKKWLDYINPADRPAFESSFLTAYHARHSYQNEYRMKNIGGEEHWFLETGVPRLNTDGSFAGMIGTSIDITERKQREAVLHENQTLRLALNKEIELRDMRNRFLRILSHEFRNPLAAILMSTETLVAYHQRLNDEQRNNRLVNIRAQIARLTEMLDDVSMIVRAESANQTVIFAPVDLVALVKAVIAPALKTSDDEAHQIEFKHPSDKVVLTADDKLLTHAITNLFGNAVKYTPAGGSIMLDLQLLNPETVQIQVKDSGIGIPEAAIPNLFNPFFRANNVGEIRGTGLGLSIVKQVVDLHHGSLDVTSALGVGSTFTLCLPTVQPANPAEHQS